MKLTISISDDQEVFLRAVAAAKNLSLEEVIAAFVELSLNLTRKGVGGPEIDLKSDLMLRLSEVSALSRRTATLLGPLEKAVADTEAIAVALQQAILLKGGGL